VTSLLIVAHSERRCHSLEGVAGGEAEADDGSMTDTAAVIDQFNAVFREHPPTSSSTSSPPIA
jgi:hypothetical protein